ncbi:MAG: hypothetical protein ACI8ZO_001159 [Flavobacteriales bacterium]|jgi:hypothetical protein
MKLLSILFLGFLTSSVTLAQEYELNNLFETRWVVNKNGGNVQNMENFELIIHNSPQTKNLPLHLKHAGLSFKKDGTLIAYTWNKCGTGNPPNHSKARYSIDEITTETVINITDSEIWNGSYVIAVLNMSNLNFKRKK